jgi:hypothetical protein
MPNDLVKASPGRVVTMSPEEFVRISKRIFGRKWKKLAAQALDRDLNTIHCYASGRRRVMAWVALHVWEWDQMMNEVERIVAERKAIFINPSSASGDILEYRCCKGMPEQFSVCGLLAVRTFLRAFAEEGEILDA